jgi:hypothetical protein
MIDRTINVSRFTLAKGALVSPIRYSYLVNILPVFATMADKVMHVSIFLLDRLKIILALIHMLSVAYLTHVNAVGLKNHKLNIRIYCSA